MQSLTHLTAWGTGIKQLPGSVEMLRNLKELILGEKTLEAKRSFSRRRVRRIESFSSFISILSLPYCGFTEADIPRDIGRLSNLHDLKLCGNNFLYLPFDFSKLPLLVFLYLNDCKNLQTLPSISNLEYLEVLYLRNCQKLVKITDLDNLPSIERIDMNNCTSLQNPFNEGFFSAPALSIPSRKHPLYQKMWLHIYLESNEIPDWFSNKVTASSICLTMPTVHNEEYKFLGMVLWFDCHFCNVPTYHQQFVVTVPHIKRSDFLFSWDIDKPDNGEVSCVYYIPCSNDTPFEGLEIKGGEQISVEDGTRKGIVKKIGVHLLYLDQHGNVTSFPAKKVVEEKKTKRKMMFGGSRGRLLVFPISRKTSAKA